MRIVWCQICTVPGRVRTLYGTLTLVFWNPAIPTGKHGESLDNMENVEKINQMSYLWFKILYSWLKTVYLSTRWLKTISFKAYITTDEKTWHMRLENMIQGQLKLGKHQTKFKSLLAPNAHCCRSCEQSTNVLTPSETRNCLFERGQISAINHPGNSLHPLNGQCPSTVYIERFFSKRSFPLR